jgi:hypothetical protein
VPAAHHDPCELHADGMLHIGWPGPEDLLFLQAPSTASSGRSMTRVTSGFE